MQFLLSMFLWDPLVAHRIKQNQRMKEKKQRKRIEKKLLKMIEKKRKRIDTNTNFTHYFIKRDKINNEKLK